MLNLFRRCLKRKLLTLILIGIFVEGVVGFAEINSVYGQLSITLKWRRNAGVGSTWMGPLAADLDNDGLMEIVITGQNGVAAVDPISGDVIWSAPYGGGHCPFEIIDLNKDGIPEIILSVQTVNGQRGIGVAALHGNNGSVYWYNPSAAGDGNYIAVADINADGYPEIFSANPGKITALSHDGRLLRRVYTYYTCWGGLSIGDTDFDGVFELYLGERSESYPSYPSGGRGLRALWADNLTEIWAYPEILCSSQAPVLADVDKDGDLEIMAHHQSSGGGLAVINTDGSVNTYNNTYRYATQIPELGRGHVTPTVADVDNDGNLELIQCGDASHNSYPPKIWDLVDWKLDATLPFPSEDPGAAADLDGDGKLEIIQPNPRNVTIFKYNPATANYDIIYTIPLSMAHAFSIAQDIDGDGDLELVFDQHNSWVSVYDVEAPAPTPLPRSGFYFYSQYRTRDAVYVPPPEQPPRIADISPSDGATNIPVSLSELSFKLTDYQSDPMDYTVTTNPGIIGGSTSGINVPSGTKITIPVSGLAPSKTYTWTVTATDGTYTTTRTFTFYTEGNVVLNISTVGDGSVIKNPDNVDNVYAYGTRVELTAVADNVVYTFSNWDGDLAWMGNNNPATILMNGNKTVIAVFTKIEYRLRYFVSPREGGSVNVNKTAPYYYGDIVELTAVPNAGYSFSQWEIRVGWGWGGNIATTNENPVTIIMDENKIVTAVFTQGQYNYTLTIDKIGNGTINKNPDKTIYTYGENVTLTATADPNWTFAGWSGDLTGSENPTTITMDDDKVVNATFIQEMYTLTVNVFGNGSVTKNPDQPTYAYGTEVNLTATPDLDWAFSEWTGDASGIDPSTTVTMDGDKVVNATFIEGAYTLTINVFGNGSVTKDPDQLIYGYGTEVNLTATPDLGWAFSEWTGDASGTDPLTIIMDGDKTVNATFIQETYTLTINVFSNGTVTKDPDLPTYTYGTEVNLTATPDPGWAFSQWGADASGTDPLIIIIMNDNKTVNATFVQAYTLTVNTVGNGAVLKDPDQLTYAYGTEVNLTASADLGWTFSEWSGDASGTETSTIVTMDGDKTVNATFIQEAYMLTINLFGNGSVTKDLDQPTYTYGTEVNLTASADLGWTFSEWTGDASGSDSSTVIIMDGNKVVNATFIEEAYALTVNVFGNGSVTKDPDQPTYTYGAEVNLTASADPGWSFSEWTGDASGTDTVTTIFMDGNKTVNATFIQEFYTLTVNIFGNGSVSKDSDQPTYTYGTEVNLTAAPDPGWAFSEWTGDASGTNPSTTITMDGDKTVNATFIQEAYTLTINIFGNGSVSKDPDQPTYTYGTQVQLTASANIGWSFSHWNGNITSSDNPITFIITSNMTITAHFKLKQYTITASVSGTGGTIDPSSLVTVYHGEDKNFTMTPDTGYHILDVLVDGVSQGSISTYTFHAVHMNHTITAFFALNEYTLTVNVYPEGSGTVTLNNTGTYYYGDAVQLTAEPNTGWYFSQWEGDLTGSQNPATIIIDGDKNITAVFTQEKLILNVTVIGNGSVIKEPDKAIYTRDEAVTLTAIAEPDWTFSGWSGDLSGLVNPATITMTGNKTITATFTINQWWCRDWQYRRTITIDHTKVSGTLTDFPVLFEILDSSLVGKTQLNGYDFVFTDADNVKLDHQIEFYDSTIGHLIVWVKVPYLSSSADTILYMYYGNPTCENQQSSTEVWDTNYKLVLHLNENTGTLYDSTINENNGTPYKIALQGVSGKIDGAVTFDGRNRYIDIPHSDTLAGYTEAFTVSFWIRLDNTNKRQTILCKYDTSALGRGWMIEYNPKDWPNNPFWFAASQDGMTYSEWWASFVPQADIWYYVTVVWEANTVPRFYINGVQVATVGGSTVGTPTISSIFNNVGVPLRIGRSVYSTRRFEGSLDEITISNQARSADWILTAYNNQFDPTTFYSVGAEETF